MSEVFDLLKVVDPHQHMPGEICDALFEGYRGERPNGSFIRWYVGQEGAALDDDNDDSEYPFSHNQLVKVDQWLLQNFQRNEEILILYWW